MDIKLDRTGECEAEVIATVSAEDAKKQRNQIVARYAAHANLPGFRPGKAPATMVAKRFAKEIREEMRIVMENAVQSDVLEQNSDLHFFRFSDPEYSENEDGSCEMKMHAAVLPKFELPEYIGIEVKTESTAVSDEEVEDCLKVFAESMATYEPVERAATEEDTVLIELKVTLGDKTIHNSFSDSADSKGDKYVYRLSLKDHYLPKLSKALIGAVSGEHREINSSLPVFSSDFEHEKKQLTFHCTVKQVLEKHVPEITPEFFENTGENVSMEDIRKSLRRVCEEIKSEQNKRYMSDQITDYLASKLSFSLPEEIVQDEIRYVLKDRLMEIVLGESPDDEPQDMDTLLADIREETMHSIRAFRALNEIAEKENINVTEQELLHRIELIKKNMDEKEFSAFINGMEPDKRFSLIWQQLLVEKTLEFLVNHAKVVDESPATETEPSQAIDD